MSDETAPTSGTGRPSVLRRLLIALVVVGLYAAGAWVMNVTNWWGVIPGAACWAASGMLIRIVFPGRPRKA